MYTVLCLRTLYTHVSHACVAVFLSRSRGLALLLIQEQEMRQEVNDLRDQKQVVDNQLAVLCGSFCTFVLVKLEKSLASRSRLLIFNLLVLCAMF